MAIEFRLTLAGDIPLEQIAALAAPEATEEPALPGYPRLFSADLSEQLGYSISINNGSNGYYDAVTDDGGLWVWEPDAYADIDFRLSVGDMGKMGVPNMFATVARVLKARNEDAALVQNGDWLLLTRVNGIIRKHRLDLWYDEALNMIPG